MTTEHQITETTAASDAVVLVLSKTRYDQLMYELNRAALFHVKQNHSDAATQHVFDLLNLITAQEAS